MILPSPFPVPGGGSCGSVWPFAGPFCGASLLLVFVFGPPLLGYVMPFLLAFLFTWLMEPLLRFSSGGFACPGRRGHCAYFDSGGGLGRHHYRHRSAAVGEISSLINNWDQVWNTFQSTYQQLAQDMRRWLSYLPQGCRTSFCPCRTGCWPGLRDMAYNLVPGTTSAVRGLSSFVLAFVFFPAGLVLYQRGLPQPPPASP